MWGTEAVVVPMQGRATELLMAAERAVIDGAWATTGDRVVIVTGTPGLEGTTGSWSTASATRSRHEPAGDRR